MQQSIKPPRALFTATLILLALLSSAVYFTRPKLASSIEIDTQGQPTIGYVKAPVHVVVIEELKCGHCREFNNEIFPKLKENYIDTGKILYTVIPVSFMPGSISAAEAAWCVFQANPRYPNDALFMTYFDYLYHAQEKNPDWATTENLEKLAKEASPAIDLTHLKDCLARQAYRIQIEENTEYANALMQGELATPAVYVNGIKVEELSWDSIDQLIKDVLEHEGYSSE